MLQQPWDTQQQADAADLALTRPSSAIWAICTGAASSGRARPALYRPDRHDAFAPDRALRAALQLGDLSLVATRCASCRNTTGCARRWRAISGRTSGLGCHALPQLPRPAQSRTRKLEPGQPWSGLERLAQRLQALGDLAPGTRAAPVLQGELLAAVAASSSAMAWPDSVIGWPRWSSSRSALPRVRRSN